MKELENKILANYLALCNLEVEKKKLTIERYKLYKESIEQTLLNHLHQWYKDHDGDPDIQQIYPLIALRNVHVYTKSDL